MKVGDYVRIKNEAGWTCIGKIENINDFREYKYCVDIQAEDFVFVDDEMIYKSSHNIIDLIEVGDYVNGYLVTTISNNLGSIYIDLREDLGGRTKLYEANIKSIVTKEQFESMEYKIG